MQQYALTIDKFINHAAKWSGDREIVCATGGPAIDRFGYATLQVRANRLSGALAALGLLTGERVGTLAWNTRHHLEAYFAIMGMGSVCHTLNPRLTPLQLAEMVNKADDCILMVAKNLMPLAQQVLAHCQGVRHIIELDSGDELGASPAPSVATHTLEQLLSELGTPYAWGEFNENAPAGLCFTSGTTGLPKGVVYTHRSNYLHTLRALQADAVGLTTRDTLLLAVPMFHANGWGLPFAAPAAGTKLVLPGRNLDGASLARLMLDEGVTVAVGVQTVWLGVVDHLEATGQHLPALERVLIGGSSCPDSLIEKLETRLGARVQTSWGMTELSPIGTIAPPRLDGANGSSGRPPVGLDLTLTDASGATLAEQRGTMGYLKVSGASVVDRYFGEDQDVLDDEGYFDTGDLAMIDADGNLSICGRSKDLIKSGGEWINPAEIEAIIGTHPSVRHVAVIARTDAKWGERPVLVVERDADGEVGTLLAMLRGKVADWWIPDQVVDIRAMPLAATGKIDKVRLRADFDQGVMVAEPV